MLLKINEDEINQVRNSVSVLSSSNIFTQLTNRGQGDNYGSRRSDASMEEKPEPSGT